MVKIIAEDTHETIVNQLQDLPFSNDKVRFWWLGQAGFIFCYKGCSLMVDPYLSDYLEKKHAGKEFDHVRMMPAPIQPQQVRNLNWVLCSHGHSDHMDPQGLPVIMRNNPECKTVAPAAEKDRIRAIELDLNRVVLGNEGDTIDLAEDMNVAVIASAHEQIKTNKAGQHYFLGYIIRFGHFTVYHSGDGVPYTGLVEKLKDKKIDVALMPVNGRDRYRTARKVVGNFTFDESFELCRRSNIPLMVCHHFGMFSFNTIDPDMLRNQIDRMEASGRVFMPQANVRYSLSK